MKRTVPLVLTFIIGMYPIFAFFVPHRVVSDLNDRLDTWLIIVAAFALPLGAVNVFMINFSKISQRRKGWPYSIVILAGLVVMGAIGVAGAYRQDSIRQFQYLFQNIVSPLQSTMFSLLSFYVASAAYRAFRARNLDAAILLVSAIVVMLGRIPFGDMLSHGSMTPLSEWLMTIPNTAAQRGIIIGAALGAASMSIRIILGIERTYLGSGKD
jgi:hypothetical protein